MKAPQSPRWSAILMVVASSLGAISLSAQSVSAPSGAAAKPDDAIVLSPFTVHADEDVGYQATNTLVGGRIQTSVDRTAAAVNILTREFLDDIGVNNFTQAAMWATNAVVPSTTSDYSEYLVNFRGLGAGNVTQNYFVWNVQSDSYNMERLEFARGPNSILFGNGNLAGIPTTFTKQAKSNAFTEVQFRKDSFGLNRVTVDENWVLPNKQGALRLNLLEQDAERWRKPSRDDRQGAYLAGAYRFTPTFSFRFDAEYGQYTRSVGDQNFFDSLSNWNKTLYTGAGAVLPGAAAAGLAQTGNGTTDWLVYNAAMPNAGILNFKGFYQTTGSGVSILPEPRPEIPNSPRLPKRDFDLQPPNNLLFGNYAFGTGYLEKTFGSDLTIQVALNRMYVDRARRGGTFPSNVRIDPNQLLPNGAPNPNVGKPYVEAQVVHGRQWSYATNYQLLGSYHWSRSWTDQTISVLSTYTDSFWRMANKRLARENNPTQRSFTNGNNAVWERIYLDRTENPPYLDHPVSSNGYNIIWHRFIYSSVLTKSFNAQVADVGSYFDGKLNTIVGVRRDSGRRTNESSTLAPDNSLIVTPSSAKDNYTTKTAGIVYFPIKQVGPFVNYSDNYAPQGSGAPLFGGREAPAATGKTREAGLHFKLFRDAVQGSFRYYDTKQSGRVMSMPGSANVNAMWVAMGLTGQQLSPVPRDTQSQAGHGIELEGTATFSRNWRIYGNYARAKAVQSDSAPGTLAYYNEHITEWRAAAATNTTVASNLKSFESAIQNVNDGRQLNLTPKYTANLYVTYSFTDSFAKGLSLSTGGRIIGPQLIGNVFGEPFNYLYQDTRYVIDSTIGYNGRFGRLRYRVQLNVYNLLDDDTLIFNSITRVNGTTLDLGNGYLFTEPRRYQLTLTFKY